MGCWEALGCFSFLQVGGSKRRRPSVKFVDPGVLPSLEEACEKAGGSFRARLKLKARRMQVAAALLPVAVCCWADLRKGRSNARRVGANSRRLRLALQGLGPAFVKLGQCAASREDMLSDEVTAELRKLCDQVPPFPSAVARALVKSELGTNAPAELGSVIAAASLGQVYRVTVRGKRFALKVQRPALAEALAADVVILRGLARCIRWLLRRLCETSLDPVDVVDNWALTLWDELDYAKEGQASEQMRKALVTTGAVPGLMIPAVCWELSSLRVLATDWVDGAKVTEHPRCVETRHINIGVQAFASMILEVGVVHADPHAGNMIIADGGKKVCLLDFGMVVSVPEAHRHAWAACIVHLVQMDHEAVLDDLIEIGFFPADCPRQEILPVMSKIWIQLVECGSDIRKRKVAVQTLYSEILILVRRFKFNLPDYYVALARALLTLEGIALAADCEFDIFKAIFPVAFRFMTTNSVNGSYAIGKALAIGGVRQAAGSLFWELQTRRALVAAATVLALGVGVYTQVTASGPPPVL